MDVVLPARFDRFPRHRAKAEAACRAALADADILAMVVTGSFATGDADELSDVDLRVYVRPDAVEAVVARIPDLAAAAGRVVALFVAEHLGIPTRTIVLYDDLVHVDIDVVATDRAAEHNDGLPAVVLWEREPISDALPRNVRSGGRRRCSMVGGSDLDVVLVHPVEGAVRRALRSLGRACSTCAPRCCSACWRSTVNAGRRAGGGRRPSSGISVTPSRERFRRRWTRRPSWPPSARRSTCIAGRRTRSSNSTGSKGPKRARSSSAPSTSAWTGHRDQRES
jgi:predicted nucleotidyltransferase